MVDSDVDDFVSAILNNTRREILRCLTLDESYALKISRLVGVSQQAVIKQLDLLEKANLIESVGTFPSDLGASRKIYRPIGFSTLIADYSKNFISLKKYELPLENMNKNNDSEDIHDSLKKLASINREIEDLMERRGQLIVAKDQILGKLHNFIVSSVHDGFARELLLDYADTLDINTVSMNNDVPEEYIRSLVKRYFG